MTKVQTTQGTTSPRRHRHPRRLSPVAGGCSMASVRSSCPDCRTAPTPLDAPCRAQSVLRDRFSGLRRETSKGWRDGSSANSWAHWRYNRHGSGDGVIADVCSDVSVAGSTSATTAMAVVMVS
ncbi:hypothetical protein ACOMHN_021339 [Nucella lapillus]